MKKNNIIKAAALFCIALGFASCSSDDTTATDGKTELRLTSGIEVETRANTQSTQIVSGEKVYVWVDDATTSTAAYEKNELTADGNGKLSGGTTMYFPQTGNNVNIYALHGNLADGVTKKGGTFTVTADQSAGGTAYTNSDLLMAYAGNVARSGNPTTQPLTFYHMLSKIELQINTGNGAPELATSGAVTISDVITNGTLTADYSKDLSSQTNRAAMVTAGTTTSKMTLPQSLSTTDATVDNEAIIVPQSMAGKVLTFTLADGGTLTYTFPTGTTFESGKKYIYKITMKLTELIVTSTVVDWGDGGSKEGDAGMADA